MYSTCLACITIDSVMNIDKKMICKFIQKSVNIEAKIDNELEKSDSE